MPTVMSTAERVDIALGCSVVRKSRALQALRSQTGACATVVEAGDDGMARHHQSLVVTWVCVNGCEWVRGYAPSPPCGGTEAGTTAVVVVVVAAAAAAAGGVVGFEEDGSHRNAFGPSRSKSDLRAHIANPAVSPPHQAFCTSKLHWQSRFIRSGTGDRATHLVQVFPTSLYA
jgi:hypothetical protein